MRLVQNNECGDCSLSPGDKIHFIRIILEFLSSMSNKNGATINVQVQTKRARPANRSRAGAAAQGKGKGRNRNRKRKGGQGHSQPTKVEYRSSDRSMVPVPRDTKNALAPSTARRKGLDDIHNFIQQMILPEWCPSIVRAPCMVNFKNHAAKFQRVVNMTIPAGGQLVGRFVPTPSFMELGNVDPVPATGDAAIYLMGVTLVESKGRCGVSLDEDNLVGYMDTFRIDGEWWWPVCVNGGNCSYVDATQAPTHCIVREADGTEHSVAFSGGVANLSGLTGVYARLEFGVDFPEVSFTQVNFGNAHIASGTMFNAYPVSLPSDTQTLRTSFLSGLITYQGSTLENQGALVCALTDPGWYPENGDAYAALSSLPDKKYNGPLRKGAYGWWGPAVLDEEVPKLAGFWDRNPSTSALWFAISGGAEGQSVKLEGNIGIEFYSPSQVFSHVAASPKAPVYQFLYEQFNNLIHVMPNDEHHDICKGLLAKCKSSVAQAARDPIALGLGLMALS